MPIFSSTPSFTKKTGTVQLHTEYSSETCKLTIHKELFTLNYGKSILFDFRITAFTTVVAYTKERSTVPVDEYYQSDIDFNRAFEVANLEWENDFVNVILTAPTIREQNEWIVAITKNVSAVVAQLYSKVKSKRISSSKKFKKSDKSTIDLIDCSGYVLRRQLHSVQPRLLYAELSDTEVIYYTDHTKSDKLGEFILTADLELNKIEGSPVALEFSEETLALYNDSDREQWINAILRRLPLLIKLANAAQAQENDYDNYIMPSPTSPPDATSENNSNNSSRRKSISRESLKRTSVKITSALAAAAVAGKDVSGEDPYSSRSNASTPSISSSSNNNNNNNNADNYGDDTSSSSTVTPRSVRSRQIHGRMFKGVSGGETPRSLRDPLEIEEDERIEPERLHRSKSLHSPKVHRVSATSPKAASLSTHHLDLMLPQQRFGGTATTATSPGGSSSLNSSSLNSPPSLLELEDSDGNSISNKSNKVIDLSFNVRVDLRSLVGSNPSLPPMISIPITEAAAATQTTITTTASATATPSTTTTATTIADCRSSNLSASESLQQQLEELKAQIALFNQQLNAKNNEIQQLRGQNENLKQILETSRSSHHTSRSSHSTHRNSTGSSSSTATPYNDNDNGNNNNNDNGNDNDDGNEDEEAEHFDFVRRPSTPKTPRTPISPTTTTTTTTTTTQEATAPTASPPAASTPSLMRLRSNSFDSPRRKMVGECMNDGSPTTNGLSPLKATSSMIVVPRLNLNLHINNNQQQQQQQEHQREHSSLLLNKPKALSAKGFSSTTTVVAAAAAMKHDETAATKVARRKSLFASPTKLWGSSSSSNKSSNSDPGVSVRVGAARLAPSTATTTTTTTTTTNAANPKKKSSRGFNLFGMLRR